MQGGSQAAQVEHRSLRDEIWFVVWLCWWCTWHAFPKPGHVHSRQWGIMLEKPQKTADEVVYSPGIGQWQPKILVWSFSRATLHSFTQGCFIRYRSRFCSLFCATGTVISLQKCCKAVLTLRFSESGRTAIGGMLILCRKEEKARQCPSFYCVMWKIQDCFPSTVYLPKCSSSERYYGPAI